MQDSLPLAVDHGSGKLPSHVVSYDGTLERWKVDQLHQLPGIYQPVA
jgi:hypothetical protein